MRLNNDRINGTIENINTHLVNTGYTIQMDNKSIILINTKTEKEENRFYLKTTRSKFDSLCRFLNLLRLFKTDLKELKNRDHVIIRFFEIAGSENY